MSRTPNLSSKMFAGITPTWSVRFKPRPVALFLVAVAVLSSPVAARASAEGGSSGLISAIGISIMAATALAFLAYLTKQPLLLAYLAAGAVIGPQFGFGWVSSQTDIKITTEIGLILLLFMIGLEMNLNKLKNWGESLLATGIFQFVLCAAMGFGFFLLLGFTIGEPFEYRIFGVKVMGGQYDLLYLAVCLALSSTTIVVKLLYEKFELGTLAGRLTLGVLVFQDIWAIVLLSIQTSLSDPKILSILLQFGEAALLIVISMTLSKYALGYLFRKIARLPELMLVASLGWCFLICALAGLFNLSLEMGAADCRRRHLHFSLQPRYHLKNRQHPRLFHHPVFCGPGNGNSQPAGQPGNFFGGGGGGPLSHRLPVPVGVPHTLSCSRTATGWAS